MPKPFEMLLQSYRCHRLNHFRSCIEAAYTQPRPRIPLRKGRDQAIQSLATYTRTPFVDAASKSGLKGRLEEAAPAQRRVVAAERCIAVLSRFFINGMSRPGLLITCGFIRSEDHKLAETV